MNVLNNLFKKIIKIKAKAWKGESAKETSHHLRGKKRAQSYRGLCAYYIRVVLK